MSGYRRAARAVRVASKGMGAGLLSLSIAIWAVSAAAQPVILMSKGQPAAALDTAGGNLASRKNVSDDGRYVVFVSSATNVIPAQSDSNGQLDVFLFDRVTKSRFLVSHVPSSETTAGNGASYSPRISGNGSFVVFTTDSTNLAGADANSGPDVFLYEVATGSLKLVSHQEGSPTVPGNGSSSATEIDITPDGAYVVYTSQATNLVSGVTDANGTRDVFLYDRVGAQTFLVSHVAGDPSTAAARLSETPVVARGLDGVFVAFASQANDLVTNQVDNLVSRDVFLYRLESDQSVLVSGLYNSPTEAAGMTSGESRNPMLDVKGATVVFETAATRLVNGVTDTNGGQDDVYSYDRGPGTLRLISHSAGDPFATAQGSSNQPALDDFATRIAFVSNANDVVPGQNDLNFGQGDVFLWAASLPDALLVSRRPGSSTDTSSGPSGSPSVSGDGQFVAFSSFSGDLVTGQVDVNGGLDVFLFEVATGGMRLVSRTQASPVTTSDSPIGSGGPLDVSGDGTYVTFDSDGSNLAAPDTNAARDVFLFTRSGGATGTNEVASLRATAISGGANGTSITSNPPRRSISDDGRYVVFASGATNLVPGQLLLDLNLGQDVFLYDRVLDKVTLISRSSADPNPTDPQQPANGQSQEPVISGDGRWVAFVSRATDLETSQTDPNGTSTDVFLWENGTGDIKIVSHTTGSATTTAGTTGQASERPVISSDGRFVAFLSQASNLVNTFADNNGTGRDVYVHDQTLAVASQNRLVSHSTLGGVIGANGASTEPVLVQTVGPTPFAFVAFTSASTNLVTGQIENNAGTDVFLWNGQTNQNVLVSHRPGQPTQTGSQASDQPSLCGSDGTFDAAYVAYRSAAPDLVGGQVEGNGSGNDIFLYERSADQNFVVSRSTLSPSRTANLPSSLPMISDDCRLVAYESAGTDLVTGFVDGNSGSTDVYEFDVSLRSTNGANRLVSQRYGAPAGNSANNASQFAQINGDGERVAFISAATDLAAGQIDTNGAFDVFVWDRTTGLTTVASRRRNTAAMTGGGTPASSGLPVLSANGKGTAFESQANNLVAGDGNNLGDAFYFEPAFTDLFIDKISPAPGGPARPGAAFSYTLIVRNLGTTAANGATVTDSFPVNFENATWTCAPSGGATCTPSGAGDLNDTVNLPAASQLLYSVNGTLALVPTFSPPFLANTSTVIPSPSITDPNPANNTDTVVDTLDPLAGLTLTHIDAPDPVGVSENLTYTATILNNGPSSAVEVKLNVDFAGATFVSVDHPNCTSPAAGPVDCSNLGNLDPGQSLVVTIVVTAPTTPGTLTSNARAESNTSPMVNQVATTDVVVGSFIRFFTVTSKNRENTLEWLAPTTMYARTKVRYRNDGSCPTSPVDTIDTLSITIPALLLNPPAGAKGKHVESSLTNGLVYCYAAYVDRDGTDTSFSAPKFVKGRPINNSVGAPEEEVQWAFSTGATAVTPPTIGSASVLAPSNDNVLYSMVRGATGGTWPETPAEFWPFPFSLPVQNRAPIIPVSVEAGSSRAMFLGSQDGTVYAVDADRGSNTASAPFWQSVALGTPGFTRVQAAPAGMFTAFGGGSNLILVGSREPGVDNEFYGLQVSNPSGGIVKWSYTGEAGNPIGVINGGAFVDYPSNRVTFASRSRSGGDTLWSLDFTEAGASRAWSRNFNDIDSSPVLRGGRVYVGNNSGQIRAVDASLGGDVWGAPYGVSDGGGAAIKGFLFPDRQGTQSDLFFTTGSRVWAITDSLTTASPKWGPITAIPGPSIPVFGRIGGIAYVWVGSTNGRLYQIDAATGAVMTSVQVGGGVSVIGAPSLDTTNTLIYVGSDSGTFYAVRVPLIP